MPKKPIDYSNTVIYKIVCNDLSITDLYVGQTTDFTKRKSQHKLSCNRSKNRHHDLKVYKTIRDNGGWDNWSMIEIEKFGCQDRNEASARERHWFEVLNAKLNSAYPNRTPSEYRVMNKEAIAKHRKEYREENIEEISRKNKMRLRANYAKNKENMLEKWRTEKFTCECGSEVLKHIQSKHFRTLKHQVYCANVKSKPNLVPDDEE